VALVATGALAPSRRQWVRTPLGALART